MVKHNLRATAQKPGFFGSTSLQPAEMVKNPVSQCRSGWSETGFFCENKLQMAEAVKNPVSLVLKI